MKTLLDLLMMADKYTSAGVDPEDPYAAQKLYFRTEKGREAKRRAEAAQRVKHADKKQEYEANRTSAKTSWQRANRQRLAELREFLLMLFVTSAPIDALLDADLKRAVMHIRSEEDIPAPQPDPALYLFFLRYIRWQHRDRRKQPPVTNPDAR